MISVKKLKNGLRGMVRTKKPKNGLRGMVRTKKLWESLKTAAIVILLISALALGSATGLYSHLFPTGAGDAASRQSAPPGAKVYAEAAAPFFIAVTNDEGERYAAKNNASAVRYVYDRVSVPLAEALGSSEEPQAASESEWRDALGGSGVFFDFLYVQPLAAIAAWLGTDVGSGVSRHSSRRICLSAEGDMISLYYICADDGLIYRCATALSGAAVPDGFEELAPNGAKFAFEFGAELADVDAYTLLTDNPPEIFRVAVRNPVGQAFSESGLTELFGMELASRYTEPDGSIVFVDVNGGTLRISSDGGVVYRAQPDSGVVPDGAAAAGALKDVVEASLGFCLNGLLVHRADADAALSGVTYNQAEGEYTLTFDYLINGVPVRLGDGHAALLVISDGMLSYASASLREFSVGAERAAVMSERFTAAVIQTTGGGEPILAYEETGAAAEARWIENRIYG